MKTIRSWIARFYVSASILVTVGIAMVDPYSQHADAMSTDGTGGVFAILLLGGVALAGLVDVAVNDWSPEHIHLPLTHRYRHVVFMLMAIGQVALTSVILQSGDIRPVIARYLLDALVSVIIAATGVR
ncbi:hypothetical protein GCM10023144_01170 [Pigmentiphaga soli]|uniref:Uncharacterized protein n=1 Tax=Pigmentiphaga soli TaxID=1007095 RepID=A0ABP8GCF2_9BURK